MNLSSPPPSKSDRIEETIIAAILGTMTLLTFANVIARYVFNANIFYALELTVFLFAWLVLFGAPYAFKKNLHLGVDALVNQAPTKIQRLLAGLVVIVCLAYALLLLKGSWDYWAPYANLPPTDGRWFPTGFVEKFRGRGWYETQDIPVPFFLTWLETAFNEGETYEKLPKVVPYIILPISMCLMVWRLIQVGQKVLKGEQTLLIVSHEAEDDVAQAAAKLKEQE